MADIILAGSTSGSITVSSPAISGTNTLTLPVATDTLVGLATTDTLTNKTLTSPVLTTPNLGTPSTLVLTNATGLAAAAMPAGSVLQVVSVHKSNTFSTATTGADNDITGMSVTITPSSASNKILILTNMEMVNDNGTSQWNILKFWRGVTQIAYQASTALAQNCTFAGYIPYADPTIFSMHYLDSPSTTAATTYKFTVRMSAGTFYVNYSQSLDSAHVSNITAMEIKG